MRWKGGTEFTATIPCSGMKAHWAAIRKQLMFLGLLQFIGILASLVSASIAEA